MSARLRALRILLLVSTSALITARGADAWAKSEGPPARVAVADLDFSNPRDVEQFRRRVETAAGSLCGRERQLDFYEDTACERGVRRRCLRELSPDQRRKLFAAVPGIRTWSGFVE